MWTHYGVYYVPYLLEWVGKYVFDVVRVCSIVIGFANEREAGVLGESGQKGQKRKKVWMSDNNGHLLCAWNGYLM